MQIFLPVAQVTDGGLEFEGPQELDTAFSIGAFLVPLPWDWDLEPGLELCRNYYKPRRFEDDRYRGHKQEEHSDSSLGYADRPDQVEQLQLESIHWGKYFPGPVTALLRKIQKLTEEILFSSFALSGVRDQDLPLITGGLREGTGWIHSTVNHFRAEFEDREGIVQHTDSGFVTVIYADRSGLEVYHDDRWQLVCYSPEHFIVNFGHSASILTQNLARPMTAVLHRVPPTKADGDTAQDRSSFTVFMGPRYDMSVYRYTSGGILEEYMGFRDFSVQKANDQGYEFHPRLLAWPRTPDCTPVHLI
jgi:hypothetical protein